MPAKVAVATKPDSLPTKVIAKPDSVTVATQQSLPIAGVPGLDSILKNYLTARDAQVNDLAGNYGSALEARLNKAAAADDLKLATSFEKEKERLVTLVKDLADKPKDAVAAVGNRVSLADLPPDSPAGMVGLRKTWTTERLKIRTTLDAALQSSLKSLGSRLTKGRDLENARKVVAYGESLAASLVKKKVLASRARVRDMIDLSSQIRVLRSPFFARGGSFA